MEGLIPFVYRAIIQYKNGRQGHHVLATWFSDSPSASYMRLPTGDSGRFQTSDTQQLFQSDCVNFSTSSPVSSSTTTTSSSPLCRRFITSRRVVS
ncbi:hypothetical protein J1N35_006514 [Gossypium stocksii]|uniref:Legume-specific protein n=1 Tax=Gossypium stocksii TaxID=47602 RepID=A0A9D3WG31_9ROSI|nr:hypothetical protein J1N35_006514 [Gossypium stocksii]